MIDNILRFVFSTQWHVIIICSAVLLLATELGFRMGKRIANVKDHASRGTMGGVQGAILALLGLLLGFTFAMSSARHEARRELVAREATSISNAYLRAAFLPPEHRDAIEKLLRDYVDVRLEFFNVGADPAAITGVEQRTAQLQARLWREALLAANAANASPAFSVPLANSLIDLFNVDGAQVAALRAHVPGAVWLLLLFVATCGCYISGYAAGTTGVRTSLPNFLLPLLIAVVITLIAALHRPRGDLIPIDVEPMRELKAQTQVHSL